MAVLLLFLGLSLSACGVVGPPVSYLSTLEDQGPASTAKGGQKPEPAAEPFEPTEPEAPTP